MHNVALVNLPDTGAAIQGRGYRGIGKLHLCAINGRLIRFHSGLKLIGLGFLRIVILLRQDFLKKQLRAR